MICRTLPIAALFLSILASGCSQDSASAATAKVDATDEKCEVSQTAFAPGTNKFELSNNGSQVTEVYVYAPGDRAVGEAENIGPGTSRDFVVDLSPGQYQVACKPGMRGTGIRTTISVSGDADQPIDPVLAQSVARYRTYVLDQTAILVTATKAFTDAVKAGDVARAKDLYGPSREPWERIEPVAESFGDIDPRIDARENDVEEGQAFTGWHRLERDLWVNGLQSDSSAIADRLMADIGELQGLIKTVELTPTQLSNGAKGLLDEVATGKVTGEEERYSRIDLVDFNANIEGAKYAYESLKPYVVVADPELVSTLDARFADVEAALAPYRQGNSFVTYDKLSPAQVRQLADKVDALGEPLSRLTNAVTS